MGWERGGDVAIVDNGLVLSGVVFVLLVYFITSTYLTYLWIKC